MNLKVHINTNMDPVKRPSKLVPKGIMVHSTGGRGASDERYADKWNVPGLGKSVHAFLDGDSITQIMPWNIKAGHCGGAANNTHLSFEMCEPDTEHWTDKETCAKVWNNALDLAAYLCKLYGLTEKNVIGHYEGHKLGLASNHADPGHWFPKIGKSMDAFRSELKLRLGPVKEQAGQVINVEKGDSLNIRALPSMSGKVIGTMPPGALLTLLGDVVDGWYSVRYGSITGYSGASYLKVVTAPQPPKPPAPTAVYHTFVKGDTLWSISKKYKVGVMTIRKLVPGSNPEKLTIPNPLAMHVGDKLRIK